MITIFTLFLVGFQLGATACALSCLPIVTPILISNSNYTNNKSFYILLQYFSGKLIAYTSISILAFFSSQFIKNSLTSASSIYPNRSFFHNSSSNTIAL